MAGEAPLRGLGVAGNGMRREAAANLVHEHQRPGRPVLRAGLLGRSIQESRSPQMHEAEGARLGLRYEYKLFDFDQLGLEDSALPGLVAKLGLAGYAGFNVTHPFKERVLACLDRLSPDADAVGAVNTVVLGEDGSVGHNTDCWGFAESFRTGLTEPKTSDVVLIGAGGAGRAVGKALLDIGVRRLAIFDTDAAKAARLATTLETRFGEGRAIKASDLEDCVRRADGLVNATPVGMAKYPGMPVEARWLDPGQWVADIVYFPAETPLLRKAREAGCQTLPGAGMAVFQAVRAFELITGQSPDKDHMASHFALP